MRVMCGTGQTRVASEIPRESVEIVASPTASGKRSQGCPSPGCVSRDLVPSSLVVSHFNLQFDLSRDPHREKAGA